MLGIDEWFTLLPNSNGEEHPILTENNHSIHDIRQFEIARLGQMAICIPDLKSFMFEVAKLVQKNLNTEYVSILKLSEDQTKLTGIEGVGWKEGAIGNILVDVDFSSQAGYTLINKKPVIVENFKAEKRFIASKLFREHEIVSGICIVISGKMRPFGILGAYSKDPLKFTHDDISFLSSVSFILSSAIIQQNSISKLKEEEEKYRILMEYASDAIIIFDQKGTILDANTRVSEMTKFSKQELLSMNITNLFLEVDLEKTPIKFQEVLDGKQIILERNLQRKDGTKIIIEISSRLLPNETIQGIYRDITLRKETEESFRNIQKMEAIERVSGSLAHDFNNYLNVLNGFIKKMSSSLHDRDFDSAVHDLNQIQKITTRASSISREFLRSSKDVYNDARIINVNDLITELDESIAILLGDKISVVYELSATKLYVKSNISQLQQSLINLVINSRDAIKDKGIITIKTFTYSLASTYRNFAFNAQPGDYVAISIIDAGSGMTDKVKAHLFEPFFTTKERKGTGLGLSSIYGFVREVNGFITVSSEPGYGTTITVYLIRVS